MAKGLPTLLLAALLSASLASGAMADGDPEKGKRAYNKCKSCHDLEPGKRKTGPHLAGIFGRKAGAVEDSRYSDSLLDSNIVWDEESLDQYITDPKSIIPNGKMSFAGIRRPDQRADLIAFLKQEAQ